ncbi:Cupin domain-containing protein [Thermosporothrix hazakensis]|uniref:Cupin domain-containing protein n=3 Tax=Thermosporothrix TaxID=768650 RepID=A0A326UD11_THEHA|nr:Cupin domain-containing protein [Thermosporothrix hazakensis]BBH85518.1 hypothetical protein KTC_02690 [Thermosporothrix sp. COM3]GCE46055.1 hypothetical protein KTH_09240 [Thermosporothrix hazakensis]
MTQEKRGYMLRENEGQAYWFLNALVLTKASSGQSENAFALQVITATRGQEPPRHIHYHQDEWFYIIEGTMSIHCGDDTWHAESGAFVCMPRGVPHSFTIESEQLKMLVITSPGGPKGFDAFVQELGRPAEQLTLPEPEKPDLQRLRQIAQKYDIEILPPAAY